MTEFRNEYSCVVLSRPACNTPDGYEPPLAADDGRSWPAPLDSVYELAQGVDGYAVDLGSGFIEIRVIMAQQQGDGAVGQFIDSVSPRVVFPLVVSGRLRGMLERRGWRKVVTANGADVWVHPKLP